MRRTVVNALSIDLEDWFHPELIKWSIKKSERFWQIEESLALILTLFDKYKTKATFFVLGEVAEQWPDLIRRLAAQGHEVACHGMSHIPLWQLNEASFTKELQDFSRLMKKILGQDYRPRGFRAPSFSLDTTTAYGLTCLADNHYEYDSSIFPAKNFMYGVKDAPLTIYRPDFKTITTPSPRGRLIEFPMTVLNIRKVRIPVSGGFYLRVIPYFLLKIFLKWINRYRPIVIYFHPWEIYKKTPRLKHLPLKNYLISYYGISRALKKVERLLQDFTFAPMHVVINQSVDATDDVKTYFNNCADRFDGFYTGQKRSFFQELAHEVFRKPGLVKRFQVTSQILAPVAGKRILDVGCGSGIYSIYFAQQGGIVTGLDFSRTMIELAKKNALEARHQINFSEGDFLTKEMEKNFDVTLFIGVFDYVKPEEVGQFLTKAKTLGSKQIVATFPKRYTPQSLIRYFWLKKQSCPVYFYTRSMIESIAREAGLTVNFYNCGPIWTVTFV